MKQITPVNAKATKHSRKKLAQKQDEKGKKVQGNTRTKPKVGEENPETILRVVV